MEEQLKPPTVEQIQADIDRLRKKLMPNPEEVKLK